MDAPDELNGSFPKKYRMPAGPKADRLFSWGGKSFGHFPFRILYVTRPCPEGDEPRPLVFFAVPKRQHKRAVERNRIRRQLRDVYRRTFRLKLLPLVERKNLLAEICILFSGKQTKFTFSELEEKLTSALARLAKKIDTPALPHEPQSASEESPGLGVAPHS